MYTNYTKEDSEDMINTNTKVDTQIEQDNIDLTRLIFEK
jgi:hypothetical protein